MSLWLVKILEVFIVIMFYIWKGGFGGLGKEWMLGMVCKIINMILVFF